ncbi:MAG: GAF domain-containing protein [Flavobacteriales bacterium]|nr:GAF domain-containing protein [Flavobacteriales bacterium]
MTPPTIPQNELERLRELESFEILDTFEEDDCDRITALASEICEAPISLICFIDEERQWFKSSQGIDATETPREYAFCAHAINEPNNVFQIPDARLDDRFHDNPLVTEGPGIVSYAGIPLKTNSGHALGMLCVIDRKPKELDENQLSALRVLADQVIHLLELRRTNKNSMISS